MENEYAIYKDLTTREIGKAEEPKLAQFRQQYASLYDMRDAIEEKKRQAEELQSQAKWAAEEAEWLKKYSGMTYDELQTVFGSLDDNAERNWVANYALSTMSSQEMKTEAAKVNWEYKRLSDLLDQYKMLTRFEQPAEGREKIEQIAAVYGSVTDLEDKVTALRERKYYLDNALRFNYLSENEDFAELSQAQENGSWMYKMVNDPSTAGKFDFGASVGKYVGPLVGTASMVYDALNFDNIQHMNDDERATFNYIYAKEGERAAREYLDYLEYSLNERSMNNAMEWVSRKTEDVPGLASLLSTPLALMGGHGWVDVAGQNLRNKVTGNYKPIDYNRDATFFNRSSDMIRDTTEQKITDTAGEFWGDAYQVGMNVLDSAAALKKIHPALGLGVAGSSAATQAMLDAKQRGATDEQALTMGFFAAGFEMLIDKYGVGRFLEGDGSLPKSEGKLLEKVIKKISGEWFDGKTTNLANSVAAYMIMAENSNYKQNIGHYLEEHSNWNYEQAEKKALLDAALKVAEADIDEWSGLVFPPKTQK